MRKLIITAAAAALVCLAVPAVAMPAKATTATVSDSEIVLAKHHVLMDGGGISEDAITDGTVIEAIIMDGIAGITAVITNAQKGENR